MTFREKINNEVLATCRLLSGEETSLIYYYHVFNLFPNVIKTEINNGKGSYDYIIKKYKVSQDDIFQIETINKQEHLVINTYLIFIPKKSLLFYYNNGSIYLYYSTNTNKDSVIEIINSIGSKFKNEVKNKIELGIITSDSYGLNLTKIENNKIEISITNNYNNDFKKLHNEILLSLNTLNSKGLVLLHGKPGTGKTSYLRYLLQEITTKNIIYITPEISHQLGEPSFLNFILSYPNSVLIIEDAETLIKSREIENNNLIANLLNLTDGLLSDCLHLQIICTFNTNIENIDKALMRKGRLIARYEFNELTIEKSNFLLNELFPNKYKTDKPLTISEIYNFSNPNYENEKKSKIGF